MMMMLNVFSTSRRLPAVVGCGLFFGSASTFIHSATHTDTHNIHTLRRHVWPVPAALFSALQSPLPVASADRQSSERKGPHFRLVRLLQSALLDYLLLFNRETLGSDDAQSILQFISNISTAISFILSQFGGLFNEIIRLNED
jgi:hypothetical protein